MAGRLKNLFEIEIETEIDAAVVLSRTAQCESLNGIIEN